MPYCYNCGKPVNETDRFCASCFVELFLRDFPHNGVRRLPTPLPEQTRTRLLTPDSKGTEQTRDYGKTRLIGPDREESQPTPVSGKTRLINYDRERANPPDTSKTHLLKPDTEDAKQSRDNGKTRFIDYDSKEVESPTALGKTRLIDDSDIEEIDILSSKPLLQQVEETRLISDSERPGTSKAAGKQANIPTINPFEFEMARANARKYKKARNTWLALAIIFLCATGAFVPLYVVADGEARHFRRDYYDIRNELITTKDEYEAQLGIKQVEYEGLVQDYRDLEKNYNELKNWKDNFDKQFGLWEFDGYSCYLDFKGCEYRAGSYWAYNPYRR